MRNLKKIVSSGCFFLCLGGWVYSGQLNGAQRQPRQPRQVRQGKRCSMPRSREAISTPDSSAKPEGSSVATASEAPQAVTTSGAPVSGAPASGQATTQAKTTDLGANVVDVDVAGRVKQLNMQETPIEQALYFFSLQTKKNIIASKNVKGTVTVNLYNVTFEEALDAMLRPNGFDYIQKGDFIYVYTAEELTEIRKRDRHTVSKVIHLSYTTALDASVLIKPLLSSVGQFSVSPPALSGLAEGNTDNGGLNNAGGDIIVLNDYQENVDTVTSALHEIDVRPKQVLIESTVLNASLDDENALGIDLISISGAADFSSLTNARPDDRKLRRLQRLRRRQHRHAHQRSRGPVQQLPWNQNPDQRRNRLRVEHSFGRLVGRVPLQQYCDVHAGPGNRVGCDGCGQPEDSCPQQAEGRSARWPETRLPDDQHHDYHHPADGAVPGCRHEADLPPVHHGRRLCSHGNPPGRFLGLAGFARRAADKHHRSDKQRVDQGRPDDRDRRFVQRIDHGLQVAGSCDGKHSGLWRAVPQDG